jgi:hypothetical protein|tara:strand:- start:65 stop:2032 length:1968 start_codon:yes stop_codon:yes gene_type:complete
MAYIPWWQRMSPPTFAERFDLGGLAGSEPRIIHGTKMGNREGFSKFEIYDKVEEGIQKITNTNTGKVTYRGQIYYADGPIDFRSENVDEVKKWRTKNLKKKPTRVKTVGKYESVKNEPHIKFNGKTYQVMVQRMKDGKWITESAEYTTDLKEAKKLRDLKVKKSPAKLPFEVVDKSVDVNKDLKKLSKSNYVKKMMARPNFKLNTADLKIVAKILGVVPSIAERRIFQLATAYTGERDMPKDWKLNKLFKKNASILVNDSNLNKKYAHLSRPLDEAKIGKIFNEKSLRTLKSEIVTDSKYIFSDTYHIDEPHSVRSGVVRKTAPYSIFAQVIDKDINKADKLKYDGLRSTKERMFHDALKTKNPNIIEKAKNDYNKFVDEWEIKLNKDTKKGQPKIKLFRISTAPPEQTIKNWSKFNEKYKSVFNKNWKNRGYSFVVPKDIKTIPEIKKSLSSMKAVNKATNLFKAGATRLMAADPLLWGFSIDDVFKKRAEGKTSMEAMGSLLFLDKPIRKGLERWKADDQQNLAYDRVNFLKRIESGDSGLQELYHMARKDPDFDGQPKDYIEFLKVMVADPAQQKLIRERDIETEEALTIPKEVVDKRKQTFKNWRSIPTVDAIRQYFLLKNDPEQYEKEYPTLTGDTEIQVAEGGIISLRR